MKKAIHKCALMYNLRTAHSQSGTCIFSLAPWTITLLSVPARLARLRADCLCLLSEAPQEGRELI